jgi:hypothetical protein
MTKAHPSPTTFTAAGNYRKITIVKLSQPRKLKNVIKSIKVAQLVCNLQNFKTLWFIKYHKQSCQQLGNVQTKWLYAFMTRWASFFQFKITKQFSHWMAFWIVWKEFVAIKFRLWLRNRGRKLARKVLLRLQIYLNRNHFKTNER